jgi:hypothetical protein
MKLLFAVLWLSTLFGQVVKGPPPTLPYQDWRACPGERCRYGEWIARRPATVFDSWDEKRIVVTRIAAGEKVDAVTGLVITFQPGVIRMDRDLAAQGLKRGDVILTYAYRGEGYSAVWFDDRYDPEFDISFAKYPDGTGCGGEHCAAVYQDLGRKVWWAQVKLASGKTGWVNMSESDFDCGC